LSFAPLSANSACCCGNLRQLRGGGGVSASTEVIIYLSTRLVFMLGGARGSTRAKTCLIARDRSVRARL